MQLLGSASQCHPAFKLDVRNSKLEYLARDTTNEEGVRRGSDSRNRVIADDIRFFPGGLVVDTVCLWLLIDMECILFARLFLALEGHNRCVLLAVMPVVDNFVARDDDVSLAHLDVFGLNSYGFAVNWTTDGVTENDVPLVLLFLILCH